MTSPVRPRTGASLQRRLLLWLLLPLLVLVPLTAALLDMLAVRPALDGLDRALTDTAVALVRLLQVHDGVPSMPLSEQTITALRADLVDEVNFAVDDGAGGLLAGDRLLIPMVSSQTTTLDPLAVDGWQFFDAMLHDRPVRVAAHRVACGAAGRTCTIVVAESLTKRQDAERAVALASLAAAVLLSLSMATLALLAVRGGLHPLRHAAQQMRKRSLQRLEPIDAASMPREVAAFVEALNDLFVRLRSAAAAQRTFLEDASHQLRTPLATVLSESAQALAQPHPPALQPTLDRLHAAAERAARLAQQLLTQARTEDASRTGAAIQPTVDLAQLASACADDWLAPSIAAGQDLGFDLRPAVVAGNALLLTELMRNLVHNATLYAGRGARVTVRTATHGTQAVIEVEDDGPGLPAEEQAQVWDRFRRGTGAPGTGAGLGLAIVRDIARAHHGDAEMLSGPHGRGLLVRASLPLAAADQAAREPVAKLS